MCRTLHCLMMMSGHGKQVGSLEDLLGMLKQFAEPEQEKEQDHGEWLKNTVAKLETNIRASEAALSIVKRDPPAGAKLVGVQAIRPVNSSTHGVLTTAIYELEGGAFRVAGTDHLTGWSISHETPNIHGLQGLLDATVHELEKQSDAAAEADKAAAKAATH